MLHDVVLNGPRDAGHRVRQHAVDDLAAARAMMLAVAGYLFVQLLSLSMQAAAVVAMLLTIWKHCWNVDLALWDLWAMPWIQVIKMLSKYCAVAVAVVAPATADVVVLYNAARQLGVKAADMHADVDLNVVVVVVAADGGLLKYPLS